MANLNSFKLSQSFFDSLPVLLNTLIVEEVNELNLDFLCRMTQLRKFTINQEVDSKIGLKFAKTKNCRVLSCYFKNNSVEVHKKGRDKYLLMIDSTKKEMNFESLTGHIGQLKSPSFGTLLLRFFRYLYLYWYFYRHY